MCKLCTHTQTHTHTHTDTLTSVVGELNRVEHIHLIAQYLHVCRYRYANNKFMHAILSSALHVDHLKWKRGGFVSHVAMDDVALNGQHSSLSHRVAHAQPCIGAL